VATYRTGRSDAEVDPEAVGTAAVGTADVPGMGPRDGAGEPARAVRTARAVRARRRLLRRADAVLASGTGSVDAVLQMGIPADRIAHAPELDDAPAPGERVVDVREGHRFAFFGPLVRRTNTEGLLHAFHLVRGIDDLLTVVGEGPLLASLVRLAEELHLGDSVVFVPEPDPATRRRLLADSQTVVVPSTDEIWGRVIAEAVAAERHVVVSTACTMAGSLGERASVFPADPTPAALARAMMTSRQQWDRRRCEEAAYRMVRLPSDASAELAGSSAER
jgi:glycosyltransferase involved in cell wall biosynthesis